MSPSLQLRNLFHLLFDDDVVKGGYYTMHVNYKAQTCKNVQTFFYNVTVYGNSALICVDRWERNSLNRFLHKLNTVPTWTRKPRKNIL